MSAQTHKKAPPGEAGVGIQVKQAEEASKQLFGGSHDANVCRTLEGSCGENGPLQQRRAGIDPALHQTRRAGREAWVMLGRWGCGYADTRAAASGACEPSIKNIALSRGCARVVVVCGNASVAGSVLLGPERAYEGIGGEVIGCSWCRYCGVAVSASRLRQQREALLLGRSGSAACQPSGCTDGGAVNGSALAVGGWRGWE